MSVSERVQGEGRKRVVHVSVGFMGSLFFS